MKKFGLKEGESIDHPWINKALERAQKRVEGRNYDIRKNLLKEPDYYVLKYTGRAMTCDEIYNSLKKIVTNKAEKMEVLTYGA